MLEAVVDVVVDDTVAAFVLAAVVVLVADFELAFVDVGFSGSVLLCTAGCSFSADAFGCFCSVSSFVETSFCCVGDCTITGCSMINGDGETTVVVAGAVTVDDDDDDTVDTVDVVNGTTIFGGGSVISLTDAISSTIFGLGAVCAFCTIFGGTTITGFGIAFFDAIDDFEASAFLNSDSVLTRIFGGDELGGMIDALIDVELAEFFFGDLFRGSLFFRSFFGLITLVTSTSNMPFDSSSSYGKNRFGSTPTSISVTL